MDAMELAAQFTEMARKLDERQRQSAAKIAKEQATADEQIRVRLELCEARCQQLLSKCRAEKLQWEKEKRLIEKCRMHGGRVRLNVGGQTFSTALATLDGPHARNTLLAAMFSGRHRLVHTPSPSPASSPLASSPPSPQTPAEYEGTVFIDRDPRVFSYILDYLRSPSTFLPPDSPADRARLVRDATFFCLPRQFFGHPQGNRVAPFQWCAPFLTDEDNPQARPCESLPLDSLWLRAKSKILSDLELALELEAQLGPILKGKLTTGLVLVHDSSRGEAADSFDNAVRGRSNLLILIQVSNQNVFGGFVEDVYGQNRGWHAGSESNFVFTLRPVPKVHWHVSGTKGLHDGCGLHLGRALVAFCTNTTHADPGFGVETPLSGSTAFVPLVMEVFEVV